MVSPTLGVALLTVLVTCRSACCGVSVALALLLPVLLSCTSACCGVAGAVALLLAVLGSNWSLWLMLAVFGAGLGLTTRTVMVRVWVAPTATVPTVQVLEAAT